MDLEIRRLRPGDEQAVLDAPALFDGQGHRDVLLRARRRRVGASPGCRPALVEALAAFAEERGCYGMWVLTEDDNIAARKNYERAGAQGSSSHLMLEWSFRTPARRQARRR